MHFGELPDCRTEILLKITDTVWVLRISDHPAVLRCWKALQEHWVLCVDAPSQQNVPLRTLPRADNLEVWGYVLSLRALTADAAAAAMFTAK